MKNRILVTGAAGFIGSHIVEHLLGEGHTVVGFDDFSTGRERNLAEVQALVGAEAWSRFTLHRNTISDFNGLQKATQEVDFIVHQAALGSVPLSIEDPRGTHNVNVTGFLNILEAARINKIRRIVYASSSSVYGNCHEMPLREESAGAVLSPYAASKLINEIYARSYAAAYGMELVGLRYFNVFGPRQDPNGAYAAVIPKWINAILSNQPVIINGTGENTRDFCFVTDVVRANIQAASVALPPGSALALNVGGGHRISLTELFHLVAGLAGRHAAPGEVLPEPNYGPARPGDILHSMADVTAAGKKIGFLAKCDLETSLKVTFEWFASNRA